MNIGTITITLDTEPIHGLVLSVDVTGDLPLITQLGAIDLARHSLLRPEEDQ